jgi:serine/threonine-protein kinase
MSHATPLLPPPPREITLGEGRRIRLVSQIGRGSVAAVMRGIYETPHGLSRTIAVKVFDVLSSEEQEIITATLAHAAREAACVQHPNVVPVIEFGLMAPGQPFVMMELVEGRSLAELVDSCARTRQRMPLDLALFIGIEIAEALAGARLARTPEGVQLGVVHGELSTNDVLLSWGGEVKVTDFGLGAAARASSSVRSIRALARRVRALAPEVARGQPGDARGDVFSLGVALREMLVGPRFPAHISEAEAIHYAREGTVPTGVFEPQLSAELRTLLARATDRDPMCRFPHAGAFAYELRRVALGMGVGDGRTFLRHAMPKLFVARDDEVTEEVPRAYLAAAPDRFAALRGERESGLVLKGEPRGEWRDDEDED